MTLKQRVKELEGMLLKEERALERCRTESEEALRAERVRGREVANLRIKEHKLENRENLNNAMDTYKEELSKDVQNFVKSTLVLLDK